jgi:Tfp pilus assembly protein PilV
MSDFLLALAAAKPSDALRLPEDTYEVKVVSAKMEKAGIVRFDLETLSGTLTATKFAGRRQIKNQPLSAAAAGYVAALLNATGNMDIASTPALGAGLENGDESVLRRFVGKTFKVKRSYNAQGDTLMEVFVAG